MLLAGLPFALISFNDDTDPKPGVRDGRATVVLGGGLDTPVDCLDMDGVLLAASVIEARGLAFTVSGSGEATVEALDGGLAVAEPGGFETDDDKGFLSAEDWSLGGIREILRVWVGTGGLGGGIPAFVGVDGVFFTGEAVEEVLTPGAVTLDRVGFVAPVPTTWKPSGTDTQQKVPKHRRGQIDVKNRQLKLISRRSSEYDDYTCLFSSSCWRFGRGGF